MVKKRNLPVTSIWDKDDIQELFEQKNIKTVHIKPFYRSLIKLNDSSNLQNAKDQDIKEIFKFEDEDWLPAIDLLPKLAKRILMQGDQYSMFSSRVITAQTSQDNSTTKLLLRLQDGKQVEAVIMRHNNRSTLCVSSQIGCKMGCTFCATGTLGVEGNLTTGEIIEQLVYAKRIEPIRNVVFMGMGEPLDNYTAVLGAIRFMTDSGLFGLAKTRVTLSTVGVIPKIKKLRIDAPFVTLALSLHAPTQKLREKIVPVAKNWKLPQLMAAIDGHIADVPGRKVFVEYIMLKDVNDSNECAHDLGKLMKGRSVTVNLIPYNETNLFDYKLPSDETILNFKNILSDEHGVFCTIRKHMGRDIDGACGQLALKSKDIEDVLSEEKSNISRSTRKKKSNNGNNEIKFKDDNDNNDITEQSIMYNLLLLIGVIAVVIFNISYLNSEYM